MTVQTEATKPSLFTTPGVLVIVGLGFVIALITTQSSLVMLCSLLFLTMGGAKLWSHVSLGQLESTLRVSRQRLFPGETLALAVDVENTKFLPVWLQVSVPVAAGLRKNGSPALTRDSGLLAYQCATFDWKLTARRRGVQLVGPVELSAADPLGFFPRQRLAASYEVIVYPRLVSVQPFAIPRRDFLGKRSPTSPVEDPSYIQGVRDYHPGRAARFIHWKASARQNRIVEKMCEVTEQERVLLLLQADHFDASSSSRALERCLELAASIGELLDRQRYAFGLSSNGRLVGGGAVSLKLARSSNQFTELLEQLARFEPVAMRSILEVVKTTTSLSRTVTVIHLSYAFDEESSALYEYLHQRKVPLVSIVAQRAEAWHAMEGRPGMKVYRLQDLHPEPSQAMSTGERTW